MKKNKSESKLFSGLKTQYLINDAGKKTAVVMDYKSFERFIEKVEDIYLGALAEQALAEETKFEDLEDIKKELVG